MKESKMIIVVRKRVERIMNERTNYGYTCVLCGHFGFAHEMTWDDRDFGGWVHWSCKMSWKKQEAAEQRFEQVMDEMNQIKEGE